MVKPLKKDGKCGKIVPQKERGVTTLNWKSILAVLLAAGLLFCGCAPASEAPTRPDTPTGATQSTAPTQPPITEPPITEPPVTEPPVTEPPITEPPVTEPPTTEPPVIEPPEKVLTVCIDAGHQRYGISEKEPNGPGSDVMKAKLTSGTRGVSTGIAEYQLNLDVSLLLEQELIARGYNVVMIRRDNDCPLSNAERAQVANDSGADIFVRIHANGSENSKVSGALCCAPTQKNPYLTDEVIDDSIRLSRSIINSFCASTGANNQGLLSTDTMTGINWCEIPVTIVEMGYMSNAAEDEKMATEEYRQKMVQGIANGIDAYFGA
jgi:N-acetylmuramoyl-L-alanine amidase